MDPYTQGAYRQIPLKLGLKFRPVWSAGPNTYVVPGKDTKLVVGRPKGKRKEKLSIWHTLPFDACALFTLWKPELLRSIGNMWFKSRDLPVEDGWEQPVVPDIDMEGGLAFGHFIERLIRPAEILW